MQIDILMALSLLLLVGGAYVHKKAAPSKVHTVAVIGMVCISMILLLIYGVSDYFTGSGINEAVLYHFKYGLGGAGFSEYLWLIAITLLFIVLGSALLFWLLSQRNENSTGLFFSSYVSYVLLTASLVSNPATLNVYTLLSLQASSAEFAAYYTEPSIAPLAKESKNLLVIYAESLERTYFDETRFPGLIKDLRELETKSISFTNIKQTTGTGWTIGGKVSSQCGIPLFTPSHGNSMSGVDRFLPSAVCLGDLLHNEGYFLTYYGGADLDFAGKRKFYGTHGFDERAGRDVLSQKLTDKKYLSGWGLYDDSLFSLAYTRFMELSALDRKFGLFMLTLDTHHPYGHPSKSCRGKEYQDGSNKILNAVACSDYLIAQFVNKVLESPYGKETVIVVLSDHLSLRNSAYDLLQSGERRNLFMVIKGGEERSEMIDAVGSTLDVGSTVLPFIGYNGSIGLGRDLTVATEQTKEEINYIQQNLRAWKKPISKFWDFPKIGSFLSIDPQRGTVTIDGRRFNVPTLIELSSELETVMKFQFYTVRGQKVLLDPVATLDQRTPFLWIDECASIGRVDKTVDPTGLCLAAGKGYGFIKSATLDGPVTYNPNDLRRLTGLPPRYRSRRATHAAEGSEQAAFRPYRVAHAGGGIDRKTYTDSHEALDYNIKNGFSYFELDFSFTQDGHLVCLHDWQHSFEKTFGFTVEEVPTLARFTSLVESNAGYKNCTLDTLAEWMNNNPSAYIVTDVKENNLKALRVMRERLPNFQKRVIPQIYNPANFKEVKEMGYEQIIWTLYRFPGSNEQVFDWVDTFRGAVAVTMPLNRGVSNLPKALGKIAIPTYVHTINAPEKMTQLFDDFKVTEIYTDYLRPLRD